METLIQLIESAAGRFPESVFLEGGPGDAGRVSLTRPELLRR